MNQWLRALWIGVSAALAVGTIVFGSIIPNDCEAKTQESSVNIEVMQNRSRETTGTPLLMTNWGQRHEYARFSPDNLRLGCWSTAIAQILYFHRLRPSGRVSYQCTTGYSINENFDLYTFDWSLFVNEFDDSTPEASINEVARYVYFTSVTIQKDFDTGSYILGHSDRAAAVAEHYNCATKLFKNSSYSLGQIKQVITQEIDARRPIMMHLRNLAYSSYHAVAVDAYRMEDGELWLHINMGNEGSDNGVIIRVEKAKPLHLSLRRRGLGCFTTTHLMTAIPIP